ncbi:MAG: hypothetical protein JSS74_00220 [Actinobacteria bacterium]|nr:hypothetical protein [Actinomycetota bacterium]
MTFARKRSGQQLPRLLLVCLAALVVVLGVGGMDLLGTGLVDTGIRTVADAAETATRAARVTALQADDARRQDRDVRAAVGRAFPAPIAIGRLAVSEISVGNPDAVQAIGGDGVTGRARLVDGAWPSRAGEAAVQAAAAEARGWRRGDRIALGAAADGGVVEVTVVGTWTAKDPADPYWAGDPAVASGHSNGAAGPVYITDDDMTRLWTTPTVTWTVRPTALAADRLGAYRAGLARLHGVPAEVDPGNRSNTAVSGDLATLLDRLTRAVTVAQGTRIVPAAIIVVLGAIAITVILAALTGARREELRLVRARGAAVRDIALAATGEALAATGTGAVLALLVLRPAGVAGFSSLIAAGLTVLIAAAVAAITAVRTSSLMTVARSDAGRGVAVALLLPALGAAAIAGFALWQLDAQGGVLAPDGSADPIASSAAAAALLALALFVPVLAVLVAAVAERVARRSRGILPVLPLRQIARRAGIAAVAILCIALAAGAATMAAGSGSLGASADRAAVRAAVGADLRVSVDAQHALPLDVGEVVHVPRVSAAVTVLSRDATVGSDTVAFLAADPAGLEVAPATRTALARDDGAAVAVAITTTLADRLSAVVGTRFTAAILPEGYSVSVEVATIVADLPGIGGGAGILADEAAVDAVLALTGGSGATPTPNQLWITTADPDAVAATLRARSDAPLRIATAATASAAPITGTSTLLLSVGALAAVLLGLLGFLAASASDRSRRAEERLALRALGLSAARQRSSRLGEVAALALFGLLGGAAAGLVVTAAVLPLMWGSGS